MNEVEVSVAGAVQVGDKRICRVSPHPSGFGFAEWNDDAGNPHSLFLPPPEMKKVFGGDIVEVDASLSEKDGVSIDGVIVKVLARSGNPVVSVSRGGFYAPEDGLGPYLASTETKEGTVVALYPDLLPENGKLKATFGKVLGNLDDTFIKTAIAVCRHGIRDEWEEACVVEAELSSKTELSLSGRKDMRSMPFVTIDGESTKDFDDAVFVERKEKGFVLYVAVADVSEYVRPGTACDEEAKRRTTSVYFPDRVIPMLPSGLSDGACSLLPGEDRYVLVCKMDVSENGEVSDEEFIEAVFRSSSRLTYAQATEMRGTDARIAAIADCAEALSVSKDLRGTMDFSMSELSLSIKNGKVVGIEMEKRTPAHLWIEDMMLAANAAAAKLMVDMGYPSLFRNHSAPCEVRWGNSVERLLEQGVDLSEREFSSVSDFASLLEEHEGKPSYWVVQSEMMKAFRPASYGSKSEGHYSLNLPAYLHFTSPIRRYPDLLVHRSIKAHLRNTPVVSESEIEEVANACSESQRRANVATRESRNAFLNDWLRENPTIPHPVVVKSSAPKGGVRVMLLDCGIETVIRNSDAPTGTEMNVFFQKMDRSGRSPEFGLELFAQRNFGKRRP